MSISRSFLPIVTAFLLTAGAPLFPAEEFGDISGQFVFEGPIEPRSPILKAGGGGGLPGFFKDIPDESLVVDKTTKGIANVFVYLRRAPEKKSPVPAPDAEKEPEVVITAKDYRFEPRAVVVRTSQKLRFVSRSPLAENIHTYTLANNQRNYVLKARDQKGVAFGFEKGETLPMPVKSDFHPWMRTTILVMDHPYAAVTDQDGKFTIRGLPAGEHKFRVWHEMSGLIDREWKVEVVGGKLTEIPPVQVPAAKLKKNVGPT